MNCTNETGVIGRWAPPSSHTFVTPIACIHIMCRHTLCPQNTPRGRETIGNPNFAGSRQPINSMICCNPRAFQSRHEGGAFSVFVDGAAKFLAENLDMSASGALITISNNELLDDEDY
jgi:uncharacterized protein DUF1559